MANVPERNGDAVNTCQELRTLLSWRWNPLLPGNIIDAII